MRKYVIYILELLDIEEQGTEFWFRKLKFIMIYNAYSNKSPFKYYISILGGGRVGVWGHAYLLILGVGGWGVQNLEKPTYIILERSLISVFVEEGGIFLFKDFVPKVYTHTQSLLNVSITKLTLSCLEFHIIPIKHLIP